MMLGFLIELPVEEHLRLGKIVTNESGFLLPFQDIDQFIGKNFAIVRLGGERRQFLFRGGVVLLAQGSKQGTDLFVKVAEGHQVHVDTCLVGCDLDSVSLQLDVLYVLQIAVGLVVSRETQDPLVID